MILKVLTAYTGSKSNTYGTNGIVGSGCDLSGAPGAVSITIYHVVPRHRVLVVTIDVVTCLRILQQKLITASIKIYTPRDGLHRSHCAARYAPCLL